MKNYLVLTSLFLTAILLASSIMAINSLSTPNLEISGNVVQAKASLCINRVPNITSDCPLSFNQSTRIEDWTVNCNLFVNYSSSFNTFFNFFEVDDGLNLSLNQTNITLSSNITGVGERQLNFYVIDNTACPIQTTYTYDFEVLWINDPPDFVGHLSSLAIQEDVTAVPFVLDDHFIDPDGDPLTYTYTGGGNFEISINNDTSEVRIRNPQSNCDDAFVYFTAFDPGNLTDDSNMVELTALCDVQQSSADAAAGGVPSPPRADCTPDWSCRRWSPCFENGTRYRECFDLNACNINRYEMTFWEECEFIPPSEPIVEEESLQDTEEVEEETEPSRVERPQQIVEESNELGLILTMLTGISFIGGLYFLFRRKIKYAYAKLAWYFTKALRKEVLLTDDIKKNLMKEASVLEKKLNKKKNFSSQDESILSLLNLYRIYFSNALGILKEYSLEDLEKKASKLIHKQLGEAFLYLNKKIVLLETKNVDLTSIQAKSLLQELRFLVVSTSNFTKKDYAYEVSELEIKGNIISRFEALMVNTYQALQFEEIAFAKKNYSKILGVYEKIPMKTRKSKLKEIQRLYDYLVYQVSYTKKHKNL